MKNRIFIYISFCLAFIILGCSKDNTEAKQLPADEPVSVLNRDAGATQISGVAFFDATDECNSPGQGAAYAISMTGDIEGCLYTFVDDFECSPSGTYREVGREHFVGTYNGASGEFWTTYKFEAKYEGCAENGSYVGAEIKGRCQHPIVEGSGTGVFEGVTGRIDFKDEIEAGNYPYRGHLQF
ncbi:hypothetical protein [Terrimonas pollutisoli]|uniref:hypothetical protein n=1 Tax=Terrimonas pollutisoli TaxID=3034147 RepID=UPI0023EDF766|nr:hypothetical protein [Terrimonas sp. H1YJ31]